MNVRLKVAIVETQRSQRQIARSSGIPEVRLSKIVRGLERATEIEQRKLARVLGVKASDLFGAEVAVA